MHPFAALLKQKLLELDTSPAVFAASIGVSKATVYTWLDGSCWPDRARVHDLAVALDR